MPRTRRCRKCGCTNNRACVMVRVPGALPHGVAELTSIITVCKWIERDLCSACVGAPDPRWQRNHKAVRAELERVGRAN